MSWTAKAIAAIALIALAVFTIIRLGELRPYVSLDVARFAALGANYDRLLPYFPPYDSIVQVKDRLPPHARLKISLPPDKHRLQYFAIRYYLYPCVISNDWDYYVDFDRTGPPPGTGAALHLGSGIAVYAKPGHAFVNEHRPHLQLFSPSLVSFAVIAAWMILLGVLFLKGMGFLPRPGERGWFYSAAYLTGTLVCSGSLWALMLLRVKTGPETVYMLMAATTAVAIYFSCRRKKIPLSSMPTLNPPPEKPTVTTRLIDGAALAIILLMLAVIIALPINVWDEMVIWVMKARIFDTHQGLDFSYGENTSNYYPLLWPLNITFYFFLLGDHDEIAKWISALTYAAFILQVRSCFLFIGVRRKFLWGLTGLYVILFHHWSFSTALAENLLLAFITALIACIVRRVNSPATAAPFLPLGLIMAAGLSLTKVEGSGLAFLCGISLLAVWKAVPLRAKDITPVAGFLLMFILPWAWMQWVLASGHDVSCYQLRGKFLFGTVWKMIGICRDFLLSSGAALLISAVLASMWFFRRRPLSPTEIFLGCMTMGLVTLSLCGGLFWPADDFLKSYPEVFTRVLVRATPAFALLWASRVLVQARP